MPINRIVLAMFVLLAPMDLIGEGDLPLDAAGGWSYISSVPVDARFEILQRPWAHEWTYKLDKFTGKVWVLGQDEHQISVWIEMPVEGREEPNNPKTISYQIYVPHTPSKQSLLLNIKNGNTWRLVDGLNGTVGQWKKMLHR